MTTDTGREKRSAKEPTNKIQKSRAGLAASKNIEFDCVESVPFGTDSFPHATLASSSSTVRAAQKRQPTEVAASIIWQSAARLWHLTRRGMRVIIAPEDVSPLEISHPRLVARKPQVASAAAEGGTTTLASNDSASAGTTPVSLASNTDERIPV